MRTNTGPTPSPTCCGGPARLTSGVALFVHRSDLWHRLWWTCDACDARVGCHPGTDQPLGTLATPALRAARVRAHAVFDALWKHDGWRRSSAYRWAAHRLGLTYDQMHIGLLDEDGCRRLIEAVNNKTQRRRDDPAQTR